jgi:dephospho-CoA kinase
MSKSVPLLVGITGGIGAGKSTVARIFHLLSIPIYSADDRAKWLMEHDEDLKHRIIQSFGKNSYNEVGVLNREFVAQEIFSNKENTKKINGLVHPAVKVDFMDWASHQHSPYVLKEAALLFESGSFQDLDKIIHVSSPLKLRISRVLIRDPKRTQEQVNEIIDRQFTDEKKNSMADFIIKNTENKMIIPQVLEIHDKLLKNLD